MLKNIQKKWLQHMTVLLCVIDKTKNLHDITLSLHKLNSIPNALWLSHILHQLPRLIASHILMASQPILSLADHKIAERLFLHPAPPRSKKWVDINTKLQEFNDAYNNQYHDSYIQF